MKKENIDIYSEARRRTVERANGCFFGIAKLTQWTRMDCNYFGCFRVKTGCEIYKKLKDTP